MFWKINMLLTIVSLGTSLIYIFGSVKWANFMEHSTYPNNSGRHKWFQGGIGEFMHILPLPCWFYVGIEGCNLASQDVPCPKITIPRGYLMSITTLICTAFGCLFIAISLPPGILDLQNEIDIYNTGYRFMFNCSKEVAAALSLPATYATAFGFMFCYGRQLRAMGNAGILNTIVGVSLPWRHTPGMALIIGSTISYCICLIVYFIPFIESNLYNICMLGAISSYLAQFLSYYVFNTTLKTIKREYKSPFGLMGAFIGSTIFCLVMIGIIFFQRDNGFAVTVYVIYLILVTIYYMLVVKKRQYFSKEESEVLLIAHVITNNLHKSRIRSVQRRGKYMNALESFVDVIHSTSEYFRLSMHSLHHSVSMPSKSKHAKYKVTPHSNKEIVSETTTQDTIVDKLDDVSQTEVSKFCIETAKLIAGDVDGVCQYESVKYALEDITENSAGLADIPTIISRMSSTGYRSTHVDPLDTSIEQTMSTIT
jgi:hypothetical protein